VAATLMPGGPVDERVFADLVVRIRRMGRPPGLATILVGDDQTSAGYVRMKQRRAEELGFVSSHVNLPETATQADLVALIERFNSDDRIDGMLVQHPTLAHIDYEQALLAVDPTKDVDDPKFRAAEPCALTAKFGESDHPTRDLTVPNCLDGVSSTVPWAPPGAF
jgi:methylenetetrahydrofolate dehydrogenase (NADP+)/methenyltetrahydrofolate cyclohydrolase